MTNFWAAPASLRKAAAGSARPCAVVPSFAFVSIIVRLPHLVVGTNLGQLISVWT